MRASDLLGLEVHSAAGQRLGVVTGLRCVQDGPVRGALAAPRVDALIISPRAIGASLGYQQRDQRGPWLLRWAVQALHRDSELVAWQDVASHEQQVTLRAGWRPQRQGADQ